MCDPVEERWEVVRADQRGIHLLERLLGEWRGLEHADDPLEPAAWHALLRKLLQANELVLSTPGQKGVQVLEAHDAALVPFAHTFVVHANDREFPRTTGATGVFTDIERRRLAALGLPVAYRDETPAAGAGTVARGDAADGRGVDQPTGRRTRAARLSSRRSWSRSTITA